MKNTFANYHPMVNFVYFLLVLICSMVLLHPVCLGISFGVSLTYAVYLKGNKIKGFFLCVLLPMLLIAALVNPAFNHEGMTILTYLPSGNPLTLESILYGLATGILLVSVCMWFVCYNEVMTSDKFIFLFGKMIPALSLLISMVLRFVPKFQTQMKLVVNAQKGMGYDVANGSLWSRAKCGMTILSSMVTWSLENAIETADSMKSRGYGLPKRSAFSIYTWESRDTKVMIWLVSLGVCIGLGGVMGGFSYRYFPTLQMHLGTDTVALWMAYVALCATPIYIEKKEVKAWQRTQSRT
ncbi:energy-coupling factor transporter transmembrane component T [Chakrabartyella piscis]|uniref:energy-coupling factor transporter transmembrane component T n=1 Tax=Chakrabartyella piscis TaxID=2918914 RepID=UPI0029589CBD|nr:energy-coupling factor transporter transmembrane component T [Chakrabartyella piscis]